MRPEQIKAEINQLEFSEKLTLVEEIWDSIAQSNNELTLKQWQKQELDNRYKDYKEGKLVMHDWKDVHEGLRVNLK